MLVLLYKPKLELFRAFWGEFGVLCLKDLVFLAIYLFLVVIVKLGLRQGLNDMIFGGRLEYIIPEVLY